jgi:hypothetical protein
MADNPNATSADPNAMMANPSAMTAATAASASLVRYGEAHQQRSHSDNQKPFHANLPLIKVNGISTASRYAFSISQSEQY